MVGYSFTATLWSRAGKAFSWKDGECMRRRYHSLPCTVLYTPSLFPYSILRCTQVMGQDNLPVHIKSQSADKLVRAWPEIAMIYGVITEFCCSIDMPGSLCFCSCVWLITMTLSGLKGKQTGLMLPVVWCVWWHISSSNHKSYRGMLYYTTVSTMSVHPGKESNQIR